MSGKDAERDLHLRLMRTLAACLKPVQLKSLIITSSDKYTVRGVVMTECPIERREPGRDFEVGLDGKNGGSIQYVSVDGRRLIPRRTKARAPGRRYHAPGS